MNNGNHGDGGDGRAMTPSGEYCPDESGKRLRESCSGESKKKEDGISRLWEVKEGETSLWEYFAALKPEGDPSGLWRRTVNALVRGKITSMEQLCRLTEKDLTRIRNLGDKSRAYAIKVRDGFCLSDLGNDSGTL